MTTDSRCPTLEIGLQIQCCFSLHYAIGIGQTQAELKKMLSARPFIPFTIVMSDGTHITVKHPENALLMKHWIYVTTDGGETAEHLYLLHVTRLQRQTQDAA